MKQTYTLFFSVVILSLLFYGCNKKDYVPVTEIQESIQVSNAQLKEILINKGYEFNDTGNLVLNEQVQNLTILDLSGTGLSDASGLGIFPSLTEVDLSNNNFYMSFDFAVLPANITGINLVGNEVYEYTGLVDVVIEENDDETVTILHALTKLYLPTSAKYNTTSLVYFYEQYKAEIEDGTVDMQMEDSDGVLSLYSTLREIPYASTRRLLKKSFPSFFKEDYIDLSKRVTTASELTRSISIESYNLEGVEYLLNHRSWKGTLLYFLSTGVSTMPYLKIPSRILTLFIKKVDTPNGIDLSDAISLTGITIIQNSNLDTLDLSASQYIGQRDMNSEENVRSSIKLHACLSLKYIEFPIASNAKYLRDLNAIELPMLKSIDLEQYEYIYNITLGLLSNECDITFFEPVEKIFPSTGESYPINFTIMKALYRGSVKDFLDLNYKQCNSLSPLKYENMDGENFNGYDWSLNY